MKIHLEKTGKKFYREWIFRELDLVIEPGEKVAILGPNGSGKSTLLQVLSGAVLPTEGKITYSSGKDHLDPEEIFQRVSMTAPYLEMIEEFTLEEIVNFHFKFKKIVLDYSRQEVVRMSGLEHASKKTFKYFSSGMKQRVKLVLALLSDVEIVFLDEPCSNLDRTAIQWYQELVKKYATNKTVVVCSNSQTEEYAFCQREINVMNWKPSFR